MTGLQTRPVVRETTCLDHRTSKPIVIRLETGGKLVRLKVKGERTVYTVTVAQLWRLGAENKLKEQRLEREARKRERRKAVPA